MNNKRKMKKKCEAPSVLLGVREETHSEWCFSWRLREKVEI
jgi:hypothetical protein